MKRGSDNTDKCAGARVAALLLLFVISFNYLYARTIVVSRSPTDEVIHAFNTIGEALAIAAYGDTVLIRGGSYEEYGLSVPDGVSLIGTGLVHIKGELAVTATIREVNETSTIDMFGNGRLENITVSARNMRYPVHSDFSPGNTRQDIVNCSFIHYGSREIYEYRKERGMLSPDGPDNIFRVQSAWGGGTMAGDRRYFTGCYFESPLRGFSTHNNVSFNLSYGASHTELKNCVMVSHGIDLDGSPLGFAAPVVIQSLESNAPDLVVLSGCIINGFLCFQNRPTHRVFCDTPGLKTVFNTAGSARTVIDQSGILADNINWYVITAGETYSCRNTTKKPIRRGTAVKAESGGFGPMTSGDDPFLFFGVALDPIAPGQTGMVKVAGYLHRAYMEGLRGAEPDEGDRIGVAPDGTFVPVKGEGIGVVSDNQNIFLLTNKNY